MRMYFVDGVVFVYGGGQQKLQEGVALCGGRVPKERSESQRTYNYPPSYRNPGFDSGLGDGDLVVGSIPA